jgi:uncharacterized protein YkwD
LTHSATRRPQRRIVARALALGVASVASAGLLAWQPGPASGWNQGSAEATVWQLLNGARVNNGLGPLQQHGTLVGLARWRSADMLDRDYFSHTILGTGCEVYCYYDSNGLSYVWGGENIGWNSGLSDDYSPVRVHEAFMESAGHRANVLNGSFTHGGVGAAAAENIQFQGYTHSPRMYTELFMQAAGGASPVPPPGGGGGGGGAPAPAPQAPAPPPSAEPEPKPVSVDKPARPTSTVGLDGVATTLTGLTDAERLARYSPAAHMLAASGDAAAAAQTSTTAGSMRVEAAPPAEAGLFDGLIGAVLGFVFG